MKPDLNAKSFLPVLGHVNVSYDTMDSTTLTQQIKLQQPI
jgi:hypothetical protein